ncbi:MAG: HD domain-containing protein [Fluviicola sp.]
MSNNQLIASVRAIISELFQNHTADHDFQHIERVTKLALHIGEIEGADLEIVELAALLHDVSDHKLNGGIINDNGRVSREFLTELHANEDIIESVCAIVDKISYKGAGVEDEKGSLELASVRDADRLDAIGAIGIARAFSFGGARKRPFFDASIPYHLHEKFEDYHTDNGHTINHFYEKLFLLKDRMQTNEGKRIAEKRHQVMLDFLEEFYNEWYVRIN